MSTGTVRTVAIGDGILDVIERDGSPTTRHAGGAALNLAVGLARLGAASSLIANVGHDPAGFWLREYLRESRVRLVETPTVDFTGVATSIRINGEPRYTFTAPMHRRRINFTDETHSEIAGADAVVVNSFPLDNAAQTELLARSFAASGGLRVVDPNPRPAIVADPGAFRVGFETLVPHSDLVKISDEDADLLYGEPVDVVAARILSLGAGAVLVTRGSDGASYLSANGERIDAAIAQLPGPIVDTLGAGDASLATMVHGLLQSAAGELDVARVLDRSMRVAAATCRTAGGLLQDPDRA